MTREEIEAGRSPKGGFTKEQLSKWGVPWPPPKGWVGTLLAGKTMQEAGLRAEEISPIRQHMSAHDLLRTVVAAVIEAGHASDLYKYPDVLEYFGAHRDARSFSRERDIINGVPGEWRDRPFFECPTCGGDLAAQGHMPDCALLTTKQTGG